MKKIALLLSLIKNAHVRGSFIVSQVPYLPVIIKILNILKQEGIVFSYKRSRLSKKKIIVILNPDSPFGDALNLGSLPSNPFNITYHELETRWKKRSPFFIISTQKGLLSKKEFFRYRLGGRPCVLVKYLGNKK